MNSKHIQHLYWRGAFGLNIQDFTKLQHKNKKQLVNSLFETSKNTTSLKVASFNDIKQYKDFRSLSVEQKRKLKKENRNKIVEFNNGTDHGTANNVFIIGKNLKKNGIYNELPNLGDLDENGDLKHSVDFRSIYATILQKWMLVDDKIILNNTFKRLTFL